MYQAKSSILNCHSSHKLTFDIERSFELGTTDFTVICTSIFNTSISDNQLVHITEVTQLKSFVIWINFDRLSIMEPPAVD